VLLLSFPTYANLSEGSTVTRQGCAGSLLLFGVSICGEPSRAQDAPHQVFLRLIETGSLSNATDRRAYLFASVRNALLNDRKSRQRSVSIETERIWFEPPNRDYAAESNLRRALENLAVIPGVRFAITAKGFPFSGLRDDGPYWTEGHLDESASARRVAVVQSISANYFRALRVPLTEGRAFHDSDGPDAAPVAIVARRLARAESPKSSAIGQRLNVNSTDASSPWLTVVDDVRYVWMDRAGRTDDLPAIPPITAILHSSRSARRWRPCRSCAGRAHRDC
jgi:MacB-like periplasmic core domain